MDQSFYSRKHWENPLILAMILLFLLPQASFSSSATPPTSDNINLSAYLFLLSQYSSRTADDINPFIILDSTSEQLAVQVDLPDLVIEPISREDGLTYHLLIAGGAGSTGLVGYPQMPAYSRNILVPNGMDVDVVVEPGNPVIYTDILVYPLQEPIANLDDPLVPAFYKDELAYASSGNYPGYYAKLLDDGMMRGQRMANFWVYPYQYDPATAELRVYSNMQVTVTFSGDIQPIEHRYQSKIFEKIYLDLAINAGEILEAEKAVEGPYTEPRYGPYGWDYLIFTKTPFSVAAGDLAAWKKKLGFKPLVTIVPNHWTALDIGSAIASAYDNWDIPPEFVLFIGDAEFIPTYYETWHDYNNALNGDSQGTIGTDLYYSLLESTNSMLPSDDLKPEVLIGRISVDEGYEAQDRVDAIINYESSPPTAKSFYDTVNMATQFQDGGTFKIFYQGTNTTTTQTIPSNGIADRRFAQTTEDIAIFLSAKPQNKTINRLYWAEAASNPTKWNDNKQPMQDGNNFNGPNTKVNGNLPKYLMRSNGFNWNTQTIAITNAINQGSFLITHRDHGNRDRWSHPNFEKQDVGLLANKNLPPVVWSVNCQTGWFDNETDFKKKPGLTDYTASDAESFSEHWERTLGSAISNDDYGAIGIVAGTRVTYSKHNDRFMMGMVDAIWPNYLSGYGSSKAQYEMAAVLYRGKAYMSSTTSDNSKERIEHETLHWFGDPSMQIRTEPPPPMILVPPNNWPWALYPHNLRVKVQKSGGSDNQLTPVTDAKVTLVKAGVSELPSSETAPLSLGPAEHWVAYTDGEGNANFPELLLPSVGDYQIIASAVNHLPVTASLVSVAGSAGGILLDRPGYRCDQDVTVKVADIDMNGNPTINVSLTSGIGDNETLLLANLGQGYFESTIPISTVGVDPGDGSIQTQDGDTLIATYDDENNGSGGVTVAAEALMDCQAPVFDGLQSLETVGCPVELLWVEASEPHTPIYYNIYRSESSGVLGEWIGYSSGTTYRDNDCQPDHDSYYIVRAIDRLENEDDNWIQLQTRP